MVAPHTNTDSRPRTAAPPLTGDTERTDQTWSGDESDEDPGLFSFMRPQTGISSATPTSPNTSVPYPPNTAASALPYSPDMFNRHSNPETTVAEEHARSTNQDDAVSSNRSPILSPAAALALQYSQAQHASEGGARRRGSWQQQGDTPDEVVGNPFSVHLPIQEGRRTSEGSSKEDGLGHFDERGRSDGSSIFDENDIRLQQIGAPLGPTRSEDEKMLREYGALQQYDRYDNVYGEEEDSPFAEVRASVDNTDDVDTPCLTFRTWFLGILMAIVVTALNVFFYLRYPSPFVTPILVQIIAYPCGKALAWALPATVWRTPKPLVRLGLPQDFSFNPGPFNIKEHTTLVIIANIATGPAFALNFTVAAEVFYGDDLGAGFDILLILTAQMCGFGVAGLCRRFLVWPAAMIWPQNLVFATLLNTLHAEDIEDIEGDTGGISRYRFLLYVSTAAFFFYWLPGFLFTALSAFSWVCWIAPNNVVVNQLFGVVNGLGMGLFTFDWTQITFIGSPLVIPWWAQVNVFCAFMLAFWVIAPAMYYTNVWNSAYLPISTSQVFDRFGMPYNTSAVLDRATLSLDVAAYEAYSPLYLPITYATTYGILLMLSTAIIVHTAVYHGKEIWQRIRKLRNEDDDIHMKLMRAYPEVPDWWYLIFLVVSVGLSIATVAAFDTQMPVWALIISLLIGFVYILPAGFVFAMTSTQVSLNLIIQLIAGYLVPGQPFANMLFKVYATQCIGGGLSFVQDLKLGHYMKIPPRTTFAVQITSTLIASIVQVGVKRWLVANVEDICSPTNSAHLVCPSARVFYSSSIIWGLIGPARLFGVGQMYNPILWWLLAGAIAPVATWALTKRFPKSWVAYINVPVALAGASFMPPATGINFSSFILFGFFFQYLLRRYKFQIWQKFAFVLSASLDLGSLICVFVIFLTLFLPKNGTITLNWWGNTVYQTTLDAQGVTYLMPPEEGFGRTSW